MKRKHVLLSGASLVLALAIAGTSVAWAAWAAGSRNPSPAPVEGHPSEESAAGTVGIAGPLGPQRFTAIAAYVQAATFSSAELNQYQDIAALLPGGRYLLDLKVTGKAGGRGPDCLGVSFPLAQSGLRGREFTGYVTVPRLGDPAVVTCYQEGSGPDSTVTYTLYYRPVEPAS